MRFDFATATRIVFGSGAVRDVPAAAREMGTRALVVTGRSANQAKALLDQLANAEWFGIDGEPTIDQVRQGVSLARRTRCDMVVSMGGGSAIDGGKAIAALLANAGDPLEYLEVVGQGQPLATPSAPFIAIPTTAGTGSEVTRNAVLGSPEHRVKASLRSAHMLPRLAVVDPDLTADLPPSLTASTGLDALTQLIEPFVCTRRNAVTDLYCEEGMRRVSRSLLHAFEDGSNCAARTDMAFASLLGGLSLANAGLGVVHGFAAPVGGMFPAPHGAVCAAVLPHGMEANVRALQARDAGSDALERYSTVARLLTGREAATAQDGIAWVQELCRKLRIPPLRTYGVTGTDIPALVEKSAKASSMKANPIVLTADELTGVIQAAL
jgi:alcohol dehydrogenase class IV